MGIRTTAHTKSDVSMPNGRAPKRSVSPVARLRGGNDSLVTFAAEVPGDESIAPSVAEAEAPPEAASVNGTDASPDATQTEPLTHAPPNAFATELKVSQEETAKRNSAAGMIQKHVRNHALSLSSRLRGAINLVTETIHTGREKSHLSDGSNPMDTVLSLGLAIDLMATSLPPFTMADDQEIALGLLDRLDSLQRVFNAECGKNGRITVEQFEAILHKASAPKRVLSFEEHAVAICAFAKVVTGLGRHGDGSLGWKALQRALMTIAIGERRLNMDHYEALFGTDDEPKKSTPDPMARRRRSLATLLIQSRTKLLRSAVNGRRALRDANLQFHQKLSGIYAPKQVGDPETTAFAPPPLLSLNSRSLRQSLAVTTPVKSPTTALVAASASTTEPNERQELSLQWPSSSSLQMPASKPSMNDNGQLLTEDADASDGVMVMRPAVEVPIAPHHSSKLLEARLAHVQESLNATSRIELPLSIRMQAASLGNAQQMQIHTAAAADAEPRLIGGYDTNPREEAHRLIRGLEEAQRLNDRTAISSKKSASRSPSPGPDEDGKAGVDDANASRKASKRSARERNAIGSADLILFETLSDHGKKHLVPTTGFFNRHIYVYVSGVPLNVTQKAVQEYFASLLPTGQVISFKFHSRTAGKLHLRSEEGLNKALSQDDWEIFGEKLTLSNSESVRVWDCRDHSDPMSDQPVSNSGQPLSRAATKRLKRLETRRLKKQGSASRKIIQEKTARFWQTPTGGSDSAEADAEGAEYELSSRRNLSFFGDKLKKLILFQSSDADVSERGAAAGGASSSGSRLKKGRGHRDKLNSQLNYRMS